MTDIAVGETGSGSVSKAGYIAPLDGLRALAVLLVLLFHISPAALPGGFAGVDVFFVISGYIITQGLVREFTNGTFSYISFLKRRFARLIPAMVATLFISSAAALLLLSPRQLSDFAQSGLAALLSAANIFFYFNSNYFDGDSSTKPLLHMWSLGVEEQFYLIWPLLIWGLHKLGGQRAILAGIALVSVLSLAATHFANSSNPSATFYLAPFRVYQLGLGAMLGVARWEFDGVSSNVATVVGSIAILAVAATATGSGHYFYGGVLPVAGAAIFLVGMRSQVAQCVFGNREMVFIGRRAYSIYLVHWPLVVFTSGISGHAVSLQSAGTLFIASIILGDLLYRCVETPLRFHGSQRSTKTENVLWLTALSQAGLIAACALFWGSNGFSQMYERRLMMIVEASKLERNDIAAMSDFGRCALSDTMLPSDFDEAGCLVPDPKAARNVLVLGDSFGIETVVGMRDLLGGTDTHVAHASYAGCAPISVSGHLKSTANCQDFNSTRLALIEKHHYDSVVVTGNWNEGHLSGLKELVEQLFARGANVYVVGVRASFDENVSDILIKAGSVADANRALATHLLAGQRQLDTELQAIVVGSGGKYIPMLDTQCSSTTCPAVDDQDNLLYYDYAHLTRAGAEILARQIVTAIPPKR